MLLQLRENSKQNENSNGSGAITRDVPGLNVQFYRLSEFKKMQPLPFKGDFNLAMAEGWLMQMEKIFEAMACIDD